MRNVLFLALFTAIASAAAGEPGWYQPRWSSVAKCGEIEGTRIVRELEESACRGGFEYRWVERGALFSTTRKCMKVVNFGDEEQEQWVDVREMGRFYCEKISRRADRAVRMFDNGELLDF